MEGAVGAVLYKRSSPTIQAPSIEHQHIIDSFSKQKHLVLQFKLSLEVPLFLLFSPFSSLLSFLSLLPLFLLFPSTMPPKAAGRPVASASSASATPAEGSARKVGMKPSFMALNNV